MTSGDGAAGLPSRRGTDATVSAVARRYGDALRAADGGRAQATVRQAHAEGLSIAAIHARVITPAMYRIGELWAQQAITIADEHVATAISHRVLAAIYPGVESDAPGPHRTMVLAAPEGQHHGLGLRMAADVLEAEGYHVLYLGTDVPADALAATVAEHEPAVVGLSVTMPLGAVKLEDAIAAVLDVRPHTQILLGGQGVPRRLIADGLAYVPSVESLVEEVQRLTTGGGARPAGSPSGRAPASRAPVSGAELRGIGTPEDQLLHATIEMGDLVRSQARSAAHFRSLALHDHLSGLANRRAFDDRFTELIAGQAPEQLAVVMVDLDGFKQINDRYGHDEGDRALIIAAAALRQALRATDFPARFGGDEFAALLPAIEPEQALRVAERLQRRLLELSGSFELAASVGIAWFDGDRRRTILRADDALYRAKAAGRNRICIAPAADA